MWLPKKGNESEPKKKNTEQQELAEHGPWWENKKNTLLGMF